MCGSGCFLRLLGRCGVCRCAFGFVRCGCLAFGGFVAVRCWDGVVWTGHRVLHRSGFPAGWVRVACYCFSCALFVVAGCVARDVFFSVRACALAFSVRVGQSTCAHELYGPPARKQG